MEGDSQVRPSNKLGQDQPIKKRDHGELAWREGIEQIAGWKGGVGEAGT